MSQWIRNYNPSEIDADDWNNILVMDGIGVKSVQHYQNYIDDGMQEKGYAWMTLPQSDIPQTVSVTIEVGNKTYTIENNGFTIEVHDSDDPMGQPHCFQSKDTIEGILEAVDGILQEELNSHCGCDELDVTALTVKDLRDIFDADEESAQRMIASLPASKKPWNKKK